MGYLRKTNLFGVCVLGLRKHVRRGPLTHIDALHDAVFHRENQVQVWYKSAFLDAGTPSKQSRKDFPCNSHVLSHRAGRRVSGEEDFVRLRNSSREG